MNFHDANWVEAVFSTMKLPDTSGVILPGSLWTSDHTGRRCKVRWSNMNDTMVEFADGPTSHCQYKTSKFLELYTEV